MCRLPRVRARRRGVAPQRAARARARDPRPHARASSPRSVPNPPQCRCRRRARHQPRAALDPRGHRGRADRGGDPRARSSATTPACRCTPPATSARSTSPSASGSSTRRGSRRASPACCRSSPRWSCASSGRRCSTSPTGAPRALGEAQHVLDFVGLVVVWLLEPAGAATGAARVIASLAVTAPRSRSARSSSRWSRVFAAPASAHAALLVDRSVERRRLRHAAEGDHAALQRRRRGLARRHPRLHQRPRARRHRQARAPERQQSVVTTSLPKLDDGTYVVTWRVISADSHPIDGAYTFQVGVEGDAERQERQGRRGVAAGDHRREPHRRRRVRHRPRRCCSPGSRSSSAARCSSPRCGPRVATTAAREWLVWSGWITVSGHHRCSASRSKASTPRGSRSTTCSTPTVFRDVLDTRYGHVALVRLALLVLAIPLLRVLLHRRPAAEHPLRWWWKLSALVVGAGIAVTPGIAGHASTGIQTGLAIPADLVHVGGHGVLARRPRACCASRSCRDATSTSCARCSPRYSALALGAIVALVVSGAYQAWRQVGSIDELKSTDYGRLLIAKLVAFAALIVAAAFSREVVNRRFRALPADDDELVARRRPGARRRRRPVGRPPARRPTAAAGRRTGGYDGRRARLGRRLGRRGRGPGGDDAPAPLGVGRGRDRGGDPRHHRDARERGAGALAEHRAGVAHAEVEPGVGVRRHRARAWPAPTTCTSPRCPPAVARRPSPT